MRGALGYVFFVSVIVMAAVVGCSSNNPVTPAAQTDQQVLEQQVTTVDSVAGFSTSDEASIDDNGMKDPDYAGIAKEAVLNFRPGAMPLADSLQALRWGRVIDWASVVRTYTVTMLGDTGALVLITKTFPGTFWVGFGTLAGDSVVIDTIVKKPFVEIVNRNVLFRRIGNSSDKSRNWLPVAISLAQGKSQMPAAFTIDSLEVSDITRGYDTAVTDPLSTWLHLGLLRGSIPRFVAGDSVTVRVTLTSVDDSAEIVVLRHSVLTRGLINRVRMRLVSATGGPGNYTRVYERTFRTSLPAILLVGRFNALVDVFSRGTINSLSAPFTNEFWASPYIVLR